MLVNLKDDKFKRATNFVNSKNLKIITIGRFF